MLSWPESLEQILVFMESGGYALWGIFSLSLALWSLIIERYAYLHLIYPSVVKQMVESLQARADMSSWFAQKIRVSMVSEIGLRLSRSLSLIKALVTVCPLLGLLGTVTGMIHVFDVLALQGSSNARAMAAGVSMATTPTMAAMVVALSGLFFSSRLQQRVVVEQQKIANMLYSMSDKQ